MQRGGFGAAIGDRDAYEHVVRSRLCVFSEHVEVTVVIENAGIDQFKLGFVSSATTILFHEARVGEFCLRILVERLHVGVCRCRIEVEVALLHVFAMVALLIGETEEPFFQDWILAVPQREREAEPTFPVSNAKQPILAPAVSAAARMIVWKIIPTG